MPVEVGVEVALQFGGSHVQELWGHQVINPIVIGRECSLEGP